MYKLPLFEGPLDLLIHLITKNKLNIYDIPIFELLEQYAAYIERMKEEDIDVASEFLEMMARLVYIKTVSLLPKHEEAEELKRELTGQLLEYQVCKEIALTFGTMASFDSIVKPPMEIEFDKTYKRRHEKEELFDAYFMAVGKGKRKLPPPAAAFSGIVQRKIVSVASKIIFVLKRLWRGKGVKVKELYGASSGKSELVATFLAVLELVKAKRIVLDDRNENIKLIGEGRRGSKGN